jgi:uroporphyrinogen III methyltransferase/synthase
VVPGVTSAIAVPAYAGIPLTHRQVASSFVVVSGAEDPGKEETFVDWDHLASTRGTLVVLMGWEALPGIVGVLLAKGRSPETPVALIRWGTEPYQQTVTGTLATILEQGRDAGLAPPVIAVIGEVVSLRDHLRWFDNRPLFGKRVLVTRSRAQASALSRLLEQEGALPVELPTIEALPPESFTALDGALEQLAAYDWVVFTSVNGVEFFFQRLHHLGKDPKALWPTRLAAIGPATARALDARGVQSDLLPGEYLSAKILEAFQDLDLVGKRILLPRPDLAGRELPQGLRERGAWVDDIAVYRTLTPQDSRQALGSLLGGPPPDIATFTSSSTVRNLVALLDGDLRLLEGACIACIGPVTADTALELGLRVDVEAQEHTIPGLVAALKKHFSARRE